MSSRADAVFDEALERLAEEHNGLSTVDSEVVHYVYDEARRHAHGCSSEDCTRPGHDYARLTLSTPSGAMQTEILLCELCLTTLEMYSHGQYMLLRRKS